MEQTAMIKFTMLGFCFLYDVIALETHDTNFLPCRVSTLIMVMVHLLSMSHRIRLSLNFFATGNVSVNLLHNANARVWHKLQHFQEVSTLLLIFQTILF